MIHPGGEGSTVKGGCSACGSKLTFLSYDRNVKSTLK